MSDFHCVTTWSRYDNHWKGVRFKTIAEMAVPKEAVHFVLCTGYDFMPGSYIPYTTNLPLDREATRAALGFDSVHEPVTAVQLSRGKAEATLLFEIALLLGDLGRLASDLLLFYTNEFAYVALPAGICNLTIPVTFFAIFRYLDPS